MTLITQQNKSVKTTMNDNQHLTHDSKHTYNKQMLCSCYTQRYKTRSSAIAVIADRTACSILTLFIVTATSRPLNKKIRLLSVQLLWICVRNPQSAYLCQHLQSAVAPCECVTVQRHRVIVDKRADSQPESHRHSWRF